MEYKYIGKCGFSKKVKYWTTSSGDIITCLHGVWKKNNQRIQIYDVKATIYRNPKNIKDAISHDYTRKM